MRPYFPNWLFLPFWASPGSSIYEWILRSNNWSSQRQAKSLAPGFPREDPVEEPPVRPVRPIPNDVPVRNPRDVPARQPKDVPAPEPGVAPKPAKPSHQQPGQKPRPIP